MSAVDAHAAVLEALDFTPESECNIASCAQVGTWAGRCLECNVVTVHCGYHRKVSLIAYEAGSVLYCRFCLGESEKPNLRYEFISIGVGS